MATQLSDPIYIETRDKFSPEGGASPGVFVVIYLDGHKGGSAQSAAVLEVVQELQRRLGSNVAHPETQLTIADLEMDRDRHEVFRNGRPIHLSPLEFALLEHLLLHRDRVQTDIMLMESVFGAKEESQGLNTLWVHMHRLRKKIDKTNPRLIHTIRGVGYILKTPPARASSPSVKTVA